MSIQHIILMFIEITAGTVTLTTLFVVMMKVVMNEEFESLTIYKSCVKINNERCLLNTLLLPINQDLWEDKLRLHIL